MKTGKAVWPSLFECVGLIEPPRMNYMASG